MQDLDGITHDQFRAAGQEPLMKVEVYVGAWTDLNSLTVGKVVEGADVSLGGASMTPNPVEGTWGASLFNQDSVFHPQSGLAYADYLRTERLVKISIGARYGGEDKYWPRMIGYMDEPKFSSSDYRIALNGGDYMKRLRETELRTPNNYWGDVKDDYVSIASDGVWGVEIYTQNDAMDPTDDGGAGYNNIGTWVDTNCDFVPFHDAGDGDAPSHFVGRCINQVPRPVRLNNPNVGAAVAGQHYQLKFWHRIVGGTGIISMRVRILQASGICADIRYWPTDDWKEETFEFEALDTGAIEWRFAVAATDHDLRLDQFSIKNFTPYYLRYYQLPGASTGAYFVEYDGDPIWQGEGDEGWWEEEATSRVFFDINKVMVSDLNVTIHYFEQQEIEDIVGSLLYLARVIDPDTDEPYADEDAARTRVKNTDEYVNPDIQIDRVWFEPGTTCLNAIKKICERCNYRFYFDYEGYPIFRPTPAVAGVADFIFTDPKQIDSISGPYQQRGEIKNRIVIKGMKRAEPVSELNTMPPRWTGERADDGVGDSIDTYGERTLTITNHLFQDQAGINAIATAMLAERKDPKWYEDLMVSFTALPFEMGDTLQWEERLTPTSNITQKGVIRDIKIDNFGVTLKCELP